MFKRASDTVLALFSKTKPGPSRPEEARLAYEGVLALKLRHYEELKAAAASVLYVRNKLEGELRERRAEIARTHQEIRTAIRFGDEGTSLSLITHKRQLMAELERAERELDEVREESVDAKNRLLNAQDELRALEREKVRALSQ